MLDESLSPLLWAQLQTLRRTLHATAELSGQEAQTAHVITQFLAAHQPDQLMAQVGGFGVAAVFEGAKPGPTVLVRSELDALPREHADDPSQGTVGAVHRCGHDGHMSMVAGLATALAVRRPAKGRVVLVFQPSEETGNGAAAMLADPRLVALAPAYAFATHNMPGYPSGSVVYRAGTMACASVGLELMLTGRPSHAAEPEKARCPSTTLSQLMVELPALARASHYAGCMATITHVQMGDLTFGVTPGYARLRVTLRAQSSEQLQQISDEAEHLVLEHAARAELQAEVLWHDHFPSTANNEALVQMLEEVAETEGLRRVRLEEPMRWSDDFGHFSSRCPGLYFGLGMGESAPGLHQTRYTFDDNVVPIGVRLFLALTSRVLDEAG